MVAPDVDGDTMDRYKCPACTKSFARKAHMLRHQQQHGPQKPFMCIFCSKSFNRSDVLRAHQMRCKERHGRSVPEGQRKGRKRSACASCVKLRTRCDQGNPCGKCQELGKDCDMTLSASRRKDRFFQKNRDSVSIQHILNPPTDEFVDRFPIRDVHLDPINGINQNSQTDDSSDTYDDSESYGEYAEMAPDMGFEYFFSGLETRPFGQIPTEPDPLLYVPYTTNLTQLELPLNLEPRAAQIRHLLFLAATSLEQSRKQLVLNALEPAINLINGAEVLTCSNLYFAKYHRHCPIIHRPSFQARKVHLALLMSTMALGAMYYTDPHKVQWMRSLLDVMELAIYSMPGIRDDFENGFTLAKATDEQTLQNQYELFQGAYLMIIVQYFSGSMAARRRARRQRFTRILDIARSFGLPSAQHPAIVSIQDEISFQAWIREETRIRQMNVMLVFDAAMGIFNNVPPRVRFSELDLQLPCDGDFFEFSSFQEMFALQTFPQPKLKVLDAFQRLFVPPNELKNLIPPGSLTFWDMLYLIHILYTYIWQQIFSDPLYRTSRTTICVPPAVIEPLKTAIKNWKSTWDEIRATVPPKAHSYMGYETSADSYWTLTKMIVQNFDANEENNTNDYYNLDDDNNGCNIFDEPGDNVGGFGVGVGAGVVFGGGGALDFLPLDTDCDSQGAHLRKILRRMK